MRAVTYPAIAIPYDNTASGLTSENVQSAIDELSNANIRSIYLQIPNRIVVTADASFKVLQDAAAVIFSQDLSRGFETIGNISVESTGIMKINSSSKGTIRGT